jgi:hypothetical protein
LSCSVKVFAGCANCLVARGYPKRGFPRAKTPAKQNSKSEYQNPKQTQRFKFQLRNPKRFVWNFPIFDHLKLFRISDFEFRICNLVYTWRALRRRSGLALRLCARYSEFCLRLRPR